MWLCNKCHNKSKATRQQLFWETPELLILCYKRYYVNNGKIIKNDKKIKTPLQLNLNKYTNNVDNKSIYSLISYTVHLGSGTNSGHYVNIRKISNNKWMVFDDNKILEIDTEKIDTSCAYYMIYEK